MGRELKWLLLYTKPHAESWAEMNLRRQGYATLLPRVRRRAGFAPLFPRYIFAGHEDGQASSSLRNTFGVLYVVHVGDNPARVPQSVIDEVRGRMDPHGVVTLEPAPAREQLFSRAQRERVRTLLKLTQAGFRVVA